MRSLTSTLTATQQGMNATPFVRLYFSLGGTTYEYKTSEADNRIMYVSHSETPYRGGATIRLRDQDGYFRAIDYRGMRVDIGYGYITGSGEEYSNAPPVWVNAQRTISVEGELVCELVCVDIWWKLSNQRAMGSSFTTPPYWDRDTTILDIIDALLSQLGITLSNDATSDPNLSDMPVYESEVNRPVRNILRDMTAMTQSVLRMTGSDTIMSLYYLHPNPASVYTYDTGHAFYSDVKEAGLVVPNRVIVCDLIPTAVTQKAQFSGSADDTFSQGKIGVYTQVFEDQSVQSDSDCQRRAEAYLSKVRTERNQGTIVVPMNCGQEMYDYITVYDTRTGEMVSGRVGSLMRTYDPTEDRNYVLEIQLGGITDIDLSPGTMLDDAVGFNLQPSPIGGGWIYGQIPVPGLGLGSQSYLSSIYFHQGDLNGQNIHNAVHWYAGTIQWADGTVLNITQGEFTSLPYGVERYIYCDIDVADPWNLRIGNLNDAIGANRCILAVVTAQASGYGLAINPIMSHGLRVVADMLADQAIREARLLGVGFIQGVHITDDTITAAKIGANQITAAKLNIVGWSESSGYIIVTDDTARNNLVSAINSSPGSTYIGAGKILVTAPGAAGRALSDWASEETGQTVIDGGKIHTYSISANKLEVNFLSAYVGNFGGGRVYIDSQGLRLYGTGLRLYDSGGAQIGDLQLSVVGGVALRAFDAPLYLTSWKNVVISSSQDLYLFAGTGRDVWVDKSFHPTADGQHSLGHGGSRWSNLWINNIRGDNIYVHSTMRPNSTDAHHSLGDFSHYWWDVHAQQLYDHSPRLPQNSRPTNDIKGIRIRQDGRYDYPTLPPQAQCRTPRGELVDGTNIGGMLQTVVMALQDALGRLDNAGI